MDSSILDLVAKINDAAEELEDLSGYYPLFVQCDRNNWSVEFGSHQILSQEDMTYNKSEIVETVLHELEDMRTYMNALITACNTLLSEAKGEVYWKGGE